MSRSIALCCCLTILFASSVFAQGKKPEPAKSPLEAKLVAKKDTYNIPAGQQGKEFAKKISAPGVRDLPAPPVVDLVLELKNPTDKPITIMVGADSGALDLKLEGEGAVTVEGQRIFTREFRSGKAVEIAPGKTHEIAIKALKFGFRGVAQQAYWTEPGEYKLSATLRWPDPAGEGGAKVVAATAEPIKLKIEAAK